MIIEIKKVFPNAVKVSFVVHVLASIVVVYFNEYKHLIEVGIGGLLTAVLSGLHRGIRLGTYKGIMEIGYGVFGWFSSSRQVMIDDIRQLEIYQTPNRYYSIELMPASGKPIPLMKCTTLKEAREELKLIREKIKAGLEVLKQEDKQV